MPQRLGSKLGVSQDDEGAMQPISWFRRVMNAAMLASCAAGAASNCANAADAPEHLPRVRPFTVHDADEKPVGLYYPPNFVQLTIGSKRYGVELTTLLPDRSRLDYTRRPLYYVTSDCSGDPYLSPGDVPPMITPVMVAAFFHTGLMFFAVADRATLIDMRSFSMDGVCRQNFADGFSAYPLGEPIDLSHRFHRPFHIK